MSLTVSPDLLDAAERGDVSDADFVACVRTSLPYAWNLVEGLVEDLRADAASDLADNVVPPPSEAERGQLLRALASDAIRSGLERHFDVRLAFQNCHRVAVFRPSAAGGERHQRFTS